MFLTSGRPTRSMRTVNLPRVSVSATTPTSCAPPRRNAVEFDDEAQDVLAVEEDRPRIGERELARRDRGQCRVRVHDERVPARPGEDAHPVPGAALLVVHPERDDLARR